MDLANDVRIVDPRDGSVRTRTLRLSDIGVDAAQAERDYYLIERGVWSAGLGSIGGITLNATAREKASKLQGVCVEAVILLGLRGRASQSMAPSRRSYVEVFEAFEGADGLRE